MDEWYFKLLIANSIITLNLEHFKNQFCNRSRKHVQVNTMLQVNFHVKVNRAIGATNNSTLPFKTEERYQIDTQLR